MAKIEALSDIGSLANTTSARAAINDNSQKIEEAFQNTLSRDGSLPNEMLADIDVNGHFILNLADPVAQTDAVNKRSVQPLVLEAISLILAALGQPGFVKQSTLTVDAGVTVVDLSTLAPFLAVHSLFYNGVYQDPSTYAVAGSTLTFSEALPADGTVSVVVSVGLAGTAVPASEVLYAPSVPGATTRSVSDRLQDILSIRDLGVVGDGVTDDTAAALIAARFNEGIYIPPGAYLLTEDIYLFGEIADSVRYTGEGKFVSMRSVLESTKQFFIQDSTDSFNTTLPIFLRRAIEERSVSPTVLPNKRVIDRAASSTSLALALHALSEYALWSNHATEELMPYIMLGADYLTAMQYQDDSVARFGGFRTAGNDQNTTAFGAGLAGRALLRAYKVSKHPRHLEAARRAVTYLKVLQNPNPRYLALYGETPIPAVPENVGFAGFCDRIQSNDTINITSSDWNVVGAVFLQEMYELEGDVTLPAIITAASNFHAFGVLNGLDYFAVKNAAPSSKVSIAWPVFSGHTYADGAWHRLGEPAGTNTVGTDQIEYGIASLYTLGYNLSTLRSAYELYRDLPTPGSGSFDAAYDGAICFTGFFRINSTVYGGSGGNTTPISVPHSRAFGSYYDLQGAGTLLKFKFDQYPDDFRKSLPITVLAVSRGALVDEAFETIWSTGTGYSFYTKGVIPIAKAAIGILEVLERQE